MGLNDREKIHHIEFLALLAFISRERQRLAQDQKRNKKFTAKDFEMAYAFKQQFTAEGAGGGGGARGGARGQRPPVQRQVLMKPHPHQQPPQLQMVDMTRSFTDTPLSRYQPTALKQKPFKGLTPGIIPSPSTEFTQAPQQPNNDNEEILEQEEGEATPTNHEDTPTEKDKKGKVNQCLKIARQFYHF